LVVAGPFAAAGPFGVDDPPEVSWTAVYPPAATTQAAAAAANARAATGLVKPRRRLLAARENSTTEFAVSWSLDWAGAVAGADRCADSWASVAFSRVTTSSGMRGDGTEASSVLISVSVALR
jgi:hypothetical protein